MTRSGRWLPIPRQRWVERRRQQLRSPLLRKLDRSFRLRLLLALVAAMASLMAVNRWEQCRDLELVRGCLWHDAGGVVNVDNLEALSIVTAAFLFILEGGKRRQREHVEAMELILSCQENHVRMSYARNEALEQLAEAGIDLAGLDLRGTDLQEIRIPGARLQGVILAGSNLAGSNLRGADLTGADLTGADLTGADLRGAVLDAARLEGAQLAGASLDPSVSIKSRPIDISDAQV